MVNESINELWTKYHLEQIIMFLMIVVVLIINLPRLNYNLVWVDEGFSILTATSPTTDDLFNYVGWDRSSSPLLYYVSLYLFTDLIGHNAFVYQLFSLIPFFLMLIVSSTFIRKEFGFFVSFTFIILSSFLFSSIVYITEIRVYEWAAFFVLMSFLHLYKVLKEPTKKQYAAFLIFSLLAAYSHYYACMAVGLLFFVLIINSILINKEERKNVAIISILAIICYSPWLIYCLSGMLNTVENYWLNFIPSLGDCLTFLFANEYGLILCIITIVCSVLVIKDNVKIDCWKKKIESTPIGIWLIGGMIAVFGSLTIAEIVCRSVHPVMVLRYLYPVSVIAWLLFSYTVINWLKDVNTKKITGVVIIAVLLIITVPQSIQISSDEKDWNDATQATIESMNCLKDDDVVLSVEYWVANSYFQAYYPNVSLVSIDANNVPALDERRHYYIFINGVMGQTNIEDQLLDQGYTFKTIFELKPLGAGYRHQAVIGDFLMTCYSLYEVCPITS